MKPEVYSQILTLYRNKTNYKAFVCEEKLDPPPHCFGHLGRSPVYDSAVDSAKDFQSLLIFFENLL